MLPKNGQSQNNRLTYIIQGLLTRVRTCMPVQVVACTNDGGVSPVGTVTIKPLVGQVDGDGNVIDHGQLYNVPYLRIQGGANGVILDPEPGDIGLAAFCDRDISVVKKSGAAGPPGSRRRHDMSDAVYIGTIIGAAPAQYVRFHAGGIVIHSPTKVRIEAPVVEVAAATSCTVTTPVATVNASTSATVTTPTLNLSATNILSSGSWDHSGSFTATGAVIGQGTNLHTHIHSGVSTGGGNTGQPV